MNNLKVIQISRIENILNNFVRLNDDGKTFGLFEEALGNEDPKNVEIVKNIINEINSGDTRINEMDLADFVNSL